MRNPALILSVALLLAGCSTVTTYHSKIAAGPPKRADYPIYAYAEGVRVPRPYEIIGTMHVGDTPFTVFGGSLDAVVNKLRENARQKGADALQLTSIEAPEFKTPNYRADANFLRFTDTWEAVSWSEEELLTYYRTNAETLDPIEGIWLGNDTAQSRVGIIKNSSKPGRDFIAFILNTRNPAWQKGDKKMDLRRGERPGVYRGNYYQDDYQDIGMAFVLRMPPKRFVFQQSDDSPLYVFTRE